MKRNSRFVFVLCALISASAMAEDVERPRPINQKTNAPDLLWGFSVDYANATSEYRSEGAKNGFGFGGSCILDFGWGRAVRLRTSYTEFNRTYIDPTIGSIDAKDGIASVGGEYYYQFTNAKDYGCHDMTRGTYFFGGGAIDRLSSRDDLAGNLTNGSGLKFEFTGGAGYQFNRNFCLEARYRHIPNSGTNLSFIQCSAVLRF
jgi:hypothetical protein